MLQLLAESLVLAIAGGGLGLLLAYLAIGPVQTLSAGSIPRVQDVSIDGNVLAFALGLTLADGPPVRSRAGLAGVAARHRRGAEGRRAVVLDRRAADGCATR